MATIKKISGLNNYEPSDTANPNIYIAVENTSESTGGIRKMALTDMPKTHQHSKSLGEITIASGGWSNKGQVCTCTGADYAHGVIMITPSSRADANNWCDYGLYVDLTYTTNDKVKFTYDADLTPPTINVMAYQVG